MKRTYCDGIGRRDFLRVGAAGALGVNLPLAQLLAAEPKLKGNDTNFIFVFLKGGMSTIDTFDLKPNAPEDVRGPFGSIPTNLPGMRVGEHLKQTAKVMHRFSQVRSFTHRNALRWVKERTCEKRCITFAVCLRCSPTRMPGRLVGILPNGPRTSSGAFGLRSNVSIVLMPPLRNTKMKLVSLPLSLGSAASNCANGRFTPSAPAAPTRRKSRRPIPSQYVRFIFSPVSIYHFDASD